jgi:hypothetical protein
LKKIKQIGNIAGEPPIPASVAVTMMIARESIPKATPIELDPS